MRKAQIFQQHERRIGEGVTSPMAVDEFGRLEAGHGVANEVTQGHELPGCRIRIDVRRGPTAVAVLRGSGHTRRQSALGRHCFRIARNLPLGLDTLGRLLLRLDALGRLLVGLDTLGPGAPVWSVRWRLSKLASARPPSQGTAFAARSSGKTPSVEPPGPASAAWQAQLPLPSPRERASVQRPPAAVLRQPQRSAIRRPLRLYPG